MASTDTTERRPAVFLDRDGVLNVRRDDHVRAWDEFVFLPGVLDALARLTSLSVPVIVITNQSVVGRGGATVDTISDIHRRMQTEIAARGGPNLAVYVCPHAPWADCACRKPKPGLLVQAADELGIDLPSSVFVGDSQSDVVAADAAGCRAILVGGTAAERAAAMRYAATVSCVETLVEAVEWILADPVFAPRQSTQPRLPMAPRQPRTVP